MCTGANKVLIRLSSRFSIGVKFNFLLQFVVYSGLYMLCGQKVQGRQLPLPDVFTC